MASIFARIFIIYVLLSAVLKIMGKRQIGELEVSELVSTLLISEVAAIPIDDPDLPLLNAIVPILFILSAEVLISTVKNRSGRWKRAIEGEPVYLIYKGKLLQERLTQNRISVNEFLSEMRVLGCADISDIEYAILEQTGKISVILKGASSPLTPRALEHPDRSGMAHTIVIDREICRSNLTSLGYDRGWLDKVLAKNNIRLSEVFLMTIDDEQRINIIKKDKK